MVGVTTREKLQWRVPAGAWDRFREYVDDEFGLHEGYLGHELERAMREYIDEDAYASVEETVDRLVTAAGRRPGRASEEKKSLLDPSKTTRVSARVHEDVKQEFRTFVADTDDTYGVAVGRAIDAYRDGGRAERLVEKLDCIVDDAEALLDETGDPDESTDESLSTVERRTIAICNQLNDQFTDDELVGAIERVAGSSQPTIEQYRQRVTGRLGVEPHPKNDRVWIPHETAAEIAGDDTPREVRQPPETLSRDDRIERLRLVAGRAAAERSSGRAQITTSEVLDEVYDRAVSRATALDLMRRAAEAPGYSLHDGSTTALRVNLNETGPRNHALFDRIIEYRDGDSTTPLQGTTAQMSDWGPATKPQADSIADAATDGGDHRVE